MFDSFAPKHFMCISGNGKTGNQEHSEACAIKDEALEKKGKSANNIFSEKNN